MPSRRAEFRPRTSETLSRMSRLARVAWRLACRPPRHAPPLAKRLTLSSPASAVALAEADAGGGVEPAVQRRMGAAIAARRRGWPTARRRPTANAPRCSGTPSVSPRTLSPSLQRSAGSPPPPALRRYAAPRRGAKRGHQATFPSARAKLKRVAGRTINDVNEPGRLVARPRICAKYAIIATNVKPHFRGKAQQSSDIRHIFARALRMR